MYVASGEFDLFLHGQVSSLKERRSIVRPLVAALRRRFDVSASEVGRTEQRQRVVIGVASVSNSAERAQQTVRACEEWIARQPTVDLLAAAIRVYQPSGDFPAG